ncbi:MAG: ISL3 family transposase, partial [Clostridia bacterium]|nr:ISL3 family transposase [Clostridia bacterium]
MKYWVQKARDKETLSSMTNLAVDETSFRKGHNYVSLFIDADQKSVKDVEQGRDGSTIDRFAAYLAEKGGDPSKIQSVTSDLSRSFLPAIERNFVKAKHIVDKFHIKKLLIDAMDEVRKQEQKGSENKRNLFLGRRLFMKPESKMTAVQKATLVEMSKMYPKTGRAYRIVAALDEFYKSKNVDEAEDRFDSLCSWMRRCRLQPMKEAAQTLKRHKDRIINYFRNRLTNAICEGINSMIQAAKRKARGYRTFDGFATMIYIVAGKLDIEDPFALRV